MRMGSRLFSLTGHREPLRNREPQRVAFYALLLFSAVLCGQKINENTFNNCLV